MNRPTVLARRGGARFPGLAAQARGLADDAESRLDKLGRLRADRRIERRGPSTTDGSLEAFYKGSQIRLISEAGPGSGYTAWARLIGQYLGRHLPGEPGIVVQSMVGAGGLVASNYMYSVAGRDGREIAALSREAPSWR